MNKPLTSFKDKKYDHDAIHLWFGLSYSNYLVLQRSLLQSMPDKWQKKFCRLLDEMNEYFDWPDTGHFRVTRIGKKGRFTHDPLANYDRGRRLVKKEELQHLF